MQLLILGIAHWQNHSPALSQLSAKRFRYRRGPGRNQYCVERSELRHAQRPIAAVNMHICISQPFQTSRRRRREFRARLDAKGNLGHVRENGRLVSTACPDFQNALAAVQASRGTPDIAASTRKSLTPRPRNCFSIISARGTANSSCPKPSPDGSLGAWSRNSFIFLRLSSRLVCPNFRSLQAEIRRATSEVHPSLFLSYPRLKQAI